MYFLYRHDRPRVSGSYLPNDNCVTNENTQGLALNNSNKANLRKCVYTLLYWLVLPIYCVQFITKKKLRKNQLLLSCPSLFKTPACSAFGCSNIPNEHPCLSC